MKWIQLLKKLSDAVTCNNVYKAEKLLGFIFFGKTFRVYQI